MKIIQNDLQAVIQLGAAAPTDRCRCFALLDSLPLLFHVSFRSFPSLTSINISCLAQQLYPLLAYNFTASPSPFLSLYCLYFSVFLPLDVPSSLFLQSSFAYFQHCYTGGTNNIHFLQAIYSPSERLKFEYHFRLRLSLVVSQLQLPKKNSLVVNGCENAQPHSQITIPVISTVYSTDMLTVNYIDRYMSLIPSAHPAQQMWFSASFMLLYCDVSISIEN